MKKRLILIGAGGHCRSCIDVIESTGEYEIAGLLDAALKPGSDVLGYPVIGNDEKIPELIADNYHFLITIGQIESAAKRMSVYNLLKESNAMMATVVSSFACISKHSRIAEGSIIMHNAFVNAGCEIGENCIINTHAVIEHDAVIGAHCHVSVNATVNGDCRIGDEAFVGSGATISNGVEIASRSVIGAGAVIHKSITEPGVYAGQPFARIR